MPLSSSIVTFLMPRSKAGLINRILGIVLFIALAYAFRYLFVDSQSISAGLLAPFLILPFVLWILNYLGKHATSSIVGMLGFNIILFLVASSEGISTGIYLHFISVSSVSIVLFGYKERIKCILFMCLSISLFLIVNLVPLNLFVFREYSEENERIFFVLHTVGAAIISAYSIFAMLDQNYNLHRVLKKNQGILEDKNIALQKANEELDSFVYSASHDLRAPLATIAGLVTLMSLEKVNSDTNYLQMIRTRITVMESFIKDIVQYSRNARLEVSYERIDLKSLVEGIEASVSHFDNAQLVQIKNDIEPDTIIYSDHHRLTVILTNLITNAIKYADLKRDTPYVRISYHKTLGIETIEIADNGIGIEVEQLPKIFDMFYRATELSKGSGLGLYITMEAAKKLDYQIEVKSEYKVGTTFTISLSAVKDPAIL
ncbi:hypothetical protein BH09BAC3_BH09BAC3_15240 [soil metagenome]